MAELKNIVIIYHDQCKDGFGAAYAAWKKFGDTATYLPMKNQSELSITLTNKIIYVLDYSFSAEIYEKLRAENQSVVTIDHHAGVESVVRKYPENVFAIEHSGAVLAWRYFHPDTPIPPLLEYVEDHDLWHFALPHNQEFNAALREYPFDFVQWDELITKLKNDTFQAEFLNTGRIIKRFEDRLINDLLQYKERAVWTEHEIWVLNVSRTYRSILGNKLVELNQAAGGVPFAVVYYRNQGAVHLSLRSADDFDVSAIARQYGGNGHPHSAGIRVESFADLPFKFI